MFNNSTVGYKQIPVHRKPSRIQAATKTTKLDYNVSRNYTFQKQNIPYSRTLPVFLLLWYPSVPSAALSTNISFISVFTSSLIICGVLIRGTHQYTCCHISPRFGFSRPLRSSTPVKLSYSLAALIIVLLAMGRLVRNNRLSRSQTQVHSA